MQNEFIDIKFQQGPIGEVGVNGCQVDDVIAFAMARLMDLNQGEFRCRQNDMAVQKLKGALIWLERRKKDRIQRGVEGTKKP